MAIPWNEDDPRDADLLVRNLSDLLRDIASQAPVRPAPTVAMAQEWHRRMYRGASLPVSYYAGELRDSDPDFPELFGYEVQIGRQSGVPSSHVPQQATQFETAMRRAVAVMDSVIPYATAAALSMRGDHQVMVAVLADLLDRHLATSTGE